jgi:hydrogenase expression/formation protein HypE
LFITTAGIGILPTERALPAPHRAAPGDAILISGSLADHGMAVMIVREGLRFTSEIHSDCAPLYGLVDRLQQVIPDIHCLRDPTRGGLAAVLNELALASGVCLEIEEEQIPIRPDVRVACELLGIDPLHVANEGKMVIIVPASDADRALSTLRAHPLGKQAARIGQVVATPAGRVHLITPLGSRRILDVPAGDLLPRIC